MYTGLLDIFVFLACDLHSCVAESLQHRQAAFQYVPAVAASFAVATQHDALEAKAGFLVSFLTTVVRVLCLEGSETSQCNSAVRLLRDCFCFRRQCRFGSSCPTHMPYDVACAKQAVCRALLTWF